MLNDNRPDQNQPAEDQDAALSEEHARPGTQAFRTIIRSTRYTPGEWAAVLEYAAALALSPSRYMRHSSLQINFGKRVNHELVVALNRIGVNLNQMVKIAASRGQPFVQAHADDVLDRLTLILETRL